MRHLVTALLVVLALVGGTVLGGVLGDQGPGFDIWPFVCGAGCAAAVAWLRLRPRRRRQPE